MLPHSLTYPASLYLWNSGFNDSCFLFFTLCPARPPTRSHERIWGRDLERKPTPWAWKDGFSSGLAARLLLRMALKHRVGPSSHCPQRHFPWQSSQQTFANKTWSRHPNRHISFVTGLCSPITFQSRLQDSLCCWSYSSLPTTSIAH